MPRGITLQRYTTEIDETAYIAIAKVKTKMELATNGSMESVWFGADDLPSPMAETVPAKTARIGSMAKYHNGLIDAG